MEQARLRELLDYDPLTGVLTWKVKRRAFGGQGVVAGTLKPSGYIDVFVDGRIYKAHRLAWLHVFGEFPPDELDHIDGNRSNNAISNLRLAAKKQNMENRKMHANNKSGHRGVHWDKQSKRWRVQVGHNGVKHYLGLFKSLEEAADVAMQAREKMFTHYTGREIQ